MKTESDFTDAVELFNAVKSTLENLRMTFAAAPEEGSIRMLAQGKGGYWDTYIQCEPDPASVHVLCIFPVKPLEEAASNLASLINSLNSRLRLGVFYQNEDGHIIYRLTMRLLAGAEAKTMAELIVGTALKTMDDEFHLIALCSSSAPQSHKALAQHLPNPKAIHDGSQSETARFQLN
jgi:hypothetical protein